MKRNTFLLAAGSLLCVALTASAVTRYVNLNNPTPASPYTTWAGAATNIQDAIDVALAGDAILVTNGVYQTGARAVYSMSNRVAVTKAVAVQSVNGAAVTSIVGSWGSGASAVRCVYLTNSTLLAGFTLKGGATQNSGDAYKNRSGGGVYCESPSAVVSNCVFTSNTANNSAGGAYSATLKNCLLLENYAAYGGATLWSTLYNCTLVNNSASGSGGATYASTLYNCIAYYNSGSSGSNYSGGTLNYCCTTPLPSGTGNVTNPPLFVNANQWRNLRLGVGSPCINPGNNTYAGGTVDLDGNPRIGGGTVDLGAYEFQAPQVRYVAQANANPIWPFTSWATAATNIQDAVDAAVEGDDVLVTNGVYQTGARDVDNGMSNRVAVTKVLNVRSVNGPAVTSIVGYPDPGSANGPAAVRCVYLTSGTLLSGFTLTNGATQASGSYSENMSGGGAWCESQTACLSNCVFTGNSASDEGGGAYQGTLVNCSLTRNSANYGAGASSATLISCSVSSNSAAFSGGGAYDGTLFNCVLSGNSSGGHGGGAYAASLTNCTLTGNWAYQRGGGAYASKLLNCTVIQNSANQGGGVGDNSELGNCILVGNSANYGGGTYWGVLSNCTLVGNSAVLSGGGASDASLYNSILYYNSAPNGPNYADDPDNYEFNYCCTIPLPATGVGNTNVEPQLASAAHLSASSPCIQAGSPAYSGGVDVDGEAWANPPSIGCDEYRSGSVTGSLSAAIVVSYTNVAVGFAVDFQALIGGRVGVSRWDFGDGVVVSNRPWTSHAWLVAGDYVVELRAYNESYPAGVAASVTVHVATQPLHYVALGSTNPVPPYSSWATAATNIQDAADAATVRGALVLVTNGVYQTGARAVYGMSNRVAVAQPITLRSVNGPAVTRIVGAGPSGAAAVRCVFLAGRAVLNGFTLTNGATQTSGDYYTNQSGGGVWCESPSAVITNCVLTGNNATLWGGGAHGGGLNSCLLAGNSAEAGGGASWATLNNCILTNNSASYSGGGAASATLNNCTLASNSASEWGGGAYSCTLNSCTLTGNWSSSVGGGAYYSILNNCTLAANSAAYDGGGGYGGIFKNCVITDNFLTGSGLYSPGSGGGVRYGTLNNCAITGNQASTGGGADSATLTNCTLTANSAGSGGGASGGKLYNCTLTGNSAYSSGGGASGGTLYNCALTANSVTGPEGAGGGARSATLYNCTLTRNSATGCGGFGGGVVGCSLCNCLVYYNSALTRENFDSSKFTNCCTTPLPETGTGNLSAEPQLASAWHVSGSSPCIGHASSTYAGGVDIDGEPWGNPPSIGCDEYRSGSVTGPLTAGIAVSYTNVAVGFSVDFQALVEGRVSASRWDFRDGVTLSNRPWTSHTWLSAGDYVVELRAYNENNPAGVAATVIVHVSPQPVHYVAQASANPVSPYTSWATAATNIQEALDAATLPGALVLVADGVYQTGARAVYGTSNRVAVTKPVTVRSVNGPAVTSIAGYQVPGLTNGPAAIRCVYMTNAALLAGFTLANGATQTSGDGDTNMSGGGVWCEPGSAVVSNCVLRGSSAYGSGGAAWGGTLNDCTLADNSAGFGGGGAYGATLNNCALTGNVAESGGGVYYGLLNHCALMGNLAYNGGGTEYATLNNCTLAGNTALSGGGAAQGTLNNCLLAGNSASYNGGGANNAMLNNCVLTNNSAGFGGGAYGGTLNNCTLAGNSATNSGGGASSGTLYNCIVYYNIGSSGGNYNSSKLTNCCTIPLPTGPGNFTNEPLFIDTNGWSNLRLQASSPCVNTGNNAYAPGSTDLDGNTRISGGTVDLGAYEFQFLDPFHAWLAQYGLPTDGSADYADPDSDGRNNWQEWAAGTNPTNATSVLRMLSATGGVSGVTVAWSSVTNRSYSLERSTNLGGTPAFSLLQSNLAGWPSATSWTDTNGLGSAPRFYRVRVEN